MFQQSVKIDRNVVEILKYKNFLKYLDVSAFRHKFI